MVEVKKFRCTYCKKVFTKLEEGYQHQRVNHPWGGLEHISEEVDFIKTRKVPVKIKIKKKDGSTMQISAMKIVKDKVPKFSKFNKSTTEIVIETYNNKLLGHERWVRVDVFQREYTKLINKLISYRKDHTGMGLAQIAVTEFRQKLGITEENDYRGKGK